MFLDYFVGKEDGSIFKAALLSGPPGVGKTTTATLVCQVRKFKLDNQTDGNKLKSFRGKRIMCSILKNHTNYVIM